MISAMHNARCCTQRATDKAIPVFATALLLVNTFLGSLRVYRQRRTTRRAQRATASASSRRRARRRTCPPSAASQWRPASWRRPALCARSCARTSRTLTCGALNPETENLHMPLSAAARSLWRPRPHFEALEGHVLLWCAHQSCWLTNSLSVPYARLLVVSHHTN